MSNIWFTSDLHEGHRNIGKFRRLPQEFIDAAKGDSTLANSLWIDHHWRKLVRPRDTVRCLGDNAFTEWGVDQIAARPGIKEAYGGNHDDLPLASYMRAFNNIRGCEKRYGVWLSHFPLHPAELRDKMSCHGHVHYETIDDWRYINLCCDNLFEETGQPMINLNSLRKTMEHRRIHKDTRIIL